MYLQVCSPRGDFSIAKRNHSCLIGNCLNTRLVNGCITLSLVIATPDMVRINGICNIKQNSKTEADSVMKTYIVLFRGINVAGKNLLPMKQLVSLLGENGFNNVRSYIQSGNVVLQGNGVSSVDLGKLVAGKFGFKPEIFVLEISEFDSAIKHNPFHSAEGKAVHFYFCSKVPKPDTAKLEKYAAESEKYQLKNKVFYLYAPNGIGRSKLVANIESCLGVPATGRNLNTINKLNEMVKNT